MITQFLASDSIESMTLALLKDGAVIIKQLVGDEVIERFNDDLRAEFDRQGHLFQGDFNGYKTRRVGAVTKFSKEFHGRTTFMAFQFHFGSRGSPQLSFPHLSRSH